MNDYDKALLQQIIGENIRERRLKKGMTLNELANSSQLDEKNIQRIESGKRFPMVPTVLKIAKALDVNPGALFEGTEQHIEIIPLFKV